MVGDVAVGGGAPISVQSMTTTKTEDVVAKIEKNEIEPEEEIANDEEPALKRIKLEQPEPEHPPFCFSSSSRAASGPPIKDSLQLLESHADLRDMEDSQLPETEDL